MTAKTNEQIIQEPPFTEDEVAIQVTGLKKTFNGTDFVLNGLNLSIPKGKITVLIGFSGTGKSVLMKHLMGLEKPTEGSIHILGENLTIMTDELITLFRRRFGVLFQNAALFDDMTAAENVMFPLMEHRPDLRRNQQKDVAVGKLKQVGIVEKDFDKLPNELSGGMRKRVGLARAIALDPEIIFYDEPTTGLDPIMTEMVDNLILGTHKSREGLTSIVISHDLSAAFRIGDYVAMLDKGQILLFGTPKDFFETDIELVHRFVTKGLHRETRHGGNNKNEPTEVS
ncbi:MAG: ABC transporter ATP-binding protein [Bdellovibrionales bacterium]